VSTAARAGAVVAALVVAAWFGLGVRQAAGTDAARADVSRLERPTAAQARATRDALDRAGTLNPDLGVEVLRARFALQEGRRADARRILEDVVRREPDGLDGWAALAVVFGDERAKAELRRLSPPPG